MDDLIPIGRFSRMCQLSVKALRLYHDQGLLAPVWVDPASGYRYYRLGQANRAEAIRILRRVDMPLEEIRRLLAEDDPEAVVKQLAMHRERLEDRLADQQRMLRFLQRLIERGGSIMPYDVAIKQVPAQCVASLTVDTTYAVIGETIAHGFGALVGAVVGAGVAPAGAPFIIFHDIIDEQTDGAIEMCIPVPDTASAAQEAVVWKTIPAGAVAWTTHRGPYAEVAPAYHTVTGWIHDHGHQIAGPPCEIYLNDPETTLPEDLLTEVQFPVHGA